MTNAIRVGQPADVPCLRPGCGATEGVLWESSRTAYHWDGKGTDPNAPLPLCRECADEHHRYWDDMWDEYHSGLL